MILKICRWQLGFTLKPSTLLVQEVAVQFVVIEVVGLDLSVTVWRKERGRIYVALSKLLIFHGLICCDVANISTLLLLTLWFDTLQLVHLGILVLRSSYDRGQGLTLWNHLIPVL